jgi:ABC-type branched-subunit amino acid transport system substrate-binding protein
MNKKASTSLRGLGIVTIILATFGCSDKAAIFQPTDRLAELKLAAIVSETGAFAATGKEQRRGLLLAQRQLNALGGVLRQPIAFDIRDDQSLPEATLRTLDEFAKSGNLIGIGPTSNASAAKVRDKLLSGSNFWLSPSATDINLGIDEKGVPLKQPILRTTPSDEDLAYALGNIAAFAPDGVGGKSGEFCTTVTVVFSLAERATATLLKREIESAAIGYTELPLEPTKKPDSEYVELAKTVLAKEKKCQILLAPGEIAISYLRAFNQLQINSTTKVVSIGYPVLRQQDFLVQGRVDPSNPASPTVGEGAYLLSPTVTSAFQGTFAGLYRQMFADDPPTVEAASAFDAATLLALSVESAKSTEPAKVRVKLEQLSSSSLAGTVAVGPERLAEAFQRIRKGENINLSGIATELDFQVSGTSAGAVKNSFNVFQVVNGTFVEVKRTEPIKRN